MALLSATAAGEGATIKGKVSFKGTPPKTIGKKVKNPKATDSTCPAAIRFEWIVVDQNGGLRDVFVYVTKGLPDQEWPVPKAKVALDQKGCTYVPHVFGVRAGQTIAISNSDPTWHNIHALPRINNQFNIAQKGSGKPIDRVFKLPEMAIKIKCEIHGWMGAWAHVMDHPFFDTSTSDGTFEITGLPPGKYAIALWTGAKLEDGIKMEVEVAKDEEKEVNFQVGRKK